MTGCQKVVGERPTNTEHCLQPVCIDELGLYIDGRQGGLGGGSPAKVVMVLLHERHKTTTRQGCYGV